MKLIENKFDGFLELENIYQYKSNYDLIFDSRSNVSLFHDFTRYDSIENQYQKVYNKYNRRINRFLNQITENTLFVRYIRDQEEADYIIINNNVIEGILKKYNNSNEVIYIANRHIEIDIEGINVFFVEPDCNDGVARKFLNKNADLYDLLMSGIYDKSKRIENLKEFKKRNRKKPLIKLLNRVIKCFNIIFIGEKKFCRQYNK